jgi:hypothetical protein
MARKISFLIISVIIVVVGVSAFSKLGYWERSAAIFTLNPQTPFSGRAGDNHKRTGELNTSEGRDLARDGIERSESDEDFLDSPASNKNISEDLNQKASHREREQHEKGTFRGDMRNGEVRRGVDSHGGSIINLGKVLMFLAVFALFTVIAIYTDRGIHLIKKRKAG